MAGASLEKEDKADADLLAEIELGPIRQQENQAIVIRAEKYGRNKSQPMPLYHEEDRNQRPYLD